MIMRSELIGASNVDEYKREADHNKDMIDKFCLKMGGNRTIQRILIANNGLAAIKLIRSIRSWSYRTFHNDKIFHLIAMATPEDMASNLEYITMADQVIQVRGGPNYLNYSNVNVIVKIAKENRADAVWAGWGHASENPLLPERLEEEGMVFIGPNATAMRALGDKISSMIVAQSAQVPCVPWSGSGIIVSSDNSGKITTINEETYRKACIGSVEEGIKMSEKVGFPLMIKASEGGGGKGIRMVQNREEFEAKYQLVAKEVPGSPIFLMKLAKVARHLEVQLIGDNYGNVVALGGRDCSVQRRHQKIIEEAPVSVFKDYEEWIQLEKAAVRLAKLVGYQSAGTVEFLYDVEENMISFLELNPRLQVEHPCTEAIANVNLPAIQLQVAMGIPLSKIPEVAIHTLNNECTVTPDGHVIACRLTAENPRNGFKPNSGSLINLQFRSSPRVWGYFSVAGNGAVHEYADSQFGHLFSHASSREEARCSMIMALKELEMQAEFHHTAEYLIRLLESETLINCQQTTMWLDKIIEDGIEMDTLEDLDVAVCGAVWTGVKVLTERKNNAIELLKKQIFPSENLLSMTHESSFIYRDCKFNLIVSQIDMNSYLIKSGNAELEVEVTNRTDGKILISYLNGTKIIQGTEDPAGLRLTIDESTALLRKEIDPSQIKSLSSGKLLKFLVNDGQKVYSGMPIAEVEVMKMIMILTSTGEGIISTLVSEGTSVKAGDLIATLKLSNFSENKLYSSTNITFPSSQNQEHASFSKLKSGFVNRILKGYYCQPRVNEEQLLDLFIDAIFNEKTLIEEFRQTIEFFHSKITPELFDCLNEVASGKIQPKQSLLDDIRRSSIDRLIKSELEERFSLLLKVTQEVSDELIGGIVEAFYQEAVIIDQSFTKEECLIHLYSLFEGDYERIFESLASWNDVELRQVLLSKLIRRYLSECQKRTFVPNILLLRLRELAKLEGKSTERISFAAKEILVLAQLPSHNKLKIEMAKKLEQLIIQGNRFSKDVMINQMVAGSQYQIDVLPAFFLHEDRKTRGLAAEIYIKRVFEAFSFVETNLIEEQSMFTWAVAAPPTSNKIGSESNDVWSLYERRAGGLACFLNEDEFNQNFKDLICRLSPLEGTKNVIYFTMPHNKEKDEYLLEKWTPIIQSYKSLLESHDIKRVTMILVQPDSFSVGYFTFRASLEWREDCHVRHVEPAMSYLLELGRIHENYSFKLAHADPTGQIHIYKGISTAGSARLFIRVLIRPNLAYRGHNTLESLSIDAKAIFSNVLDAVAMVQGKEGCFLNCNHMFINVLPTFYAHPEEAASMFETLMIHNYGKIKSLRMMEGEIRMSMGRAKYELPERYRYFFFNEVDGLPKMEYYHETLDESNNLILQNISEKSGNSLTGRLVKLAHPLLSEIQLKRCRVNSLGSSYVYDFPDIFQKVYNKLTDGLGVCNFYELILNNDGSLTETSRPAGQNDIGMVVWKMEMQLQGNTPPLRFILIANDIDYKIGSFGVKEDILFAEASKYARKHKIPRIYLSANSGARIGITEAIKNLFKVRWNDPNNPKEGIKYLYLNEADYEKVKELVIVEKNGNDYRIKGLLGGEGVENLSGSALIASETSLAYNEIFTLTYVSGRAVGIGAYLVRLGQRVIQKISQPIILTGYQALNQVLGREVYTSNLQIGGPQVMASNGISHRLVSNDFEGVEEILKWLQFLPTPGIPLAVRSSDDPIDRLIEFDPSKVSDVYDPRLLLNGSWKGQYYAAGLLDKNTFIEYMEDWAKSVVVGRGFLGGLPVGVIVPENRCISDVVLADPACESSTAQTIRRAGQVWYPDSSFKTAQFIQDVNKEGLPLIILANWRGFSGGQRDMYDQILKFGSYIVDALREFKQPVMVYIPPGGQLRGGSWVVLDQQINPKLIEVYADPTARGGILEPEGIVSIKFKKQALKSILNNIDLDDNESNISIARQVACEFADLHDTPARMKSVGAIRDVVPLREARRFLFHRITHKLAELNKEISLELQ